MAYLSFAPEAGETGIAYRAFPATNVEEFSRIEHRVIALAGREDVTRALSHRSRRGRFLERLFGVTLDRPLADPRLESLRRFASLLSHNPARVGEADVQAFIRAGFSRHQATGLAAMVTAGGRPQPHPIA